MKNYERINKGKRQVGRPLIRRKHRLISCKSQAHTDSDTAHENSPTSTRSTFSSESTSHDEQPSADCSSTSADYNSTLTDSSFSSSAGSSTDIPAQESSQVNDDSGSMQLFADLTKLTLPSSKWVIQNDVHHVGICKLSNHPTSSTVSFAVSICVTVYSDHSWSVSVNGAEFHHENSEILSSFPETIDVHTLELLIATLDKCIICPGNPDHKFVEMAEAKKGKLISRNGDQVTARLDKAQSVVVDGIMYSSTVRATNCDVLIKGRKCAACVAYRKCLRSMYHHWVKQNRKSPVQDPSSSKINIRYLNTPEKISRYSKLRGKCRAQSKEIERLKKRIEDAVEKNNVCLDSTMNNDFIQIMNEMTETVHSEHPEGSFKRIFWDQQVSANRVKNSRQNRWHPALIKWCLHLKFMSSACYNAIRTSGLISLPSERTLRDYTHWIKAGIGFSSEVDTQLIKEAKINEERDKYVVLLWDEMKIHEDLIFDKHTCELIGFVNVGTVNALIDKMAEGGDNSRTVASHMLLFMVRGMFSKLEFPYAHFATRGISADALFPLVWDAVYRLESVGFNVIAFSCDGASPNRKFYKMNRTEKGLVYKTNNPFSADREICFICDVPHLIKTTRNCWSNSFSHQNSRALWVSTVNFFCI